MLALLVGISATFFTANRNFFGKSFLLSLSSVPLCIPALLIALGFVSFFGISGTLNTIIKTLCDSDEPFFKSLYSFSGIIIAQGFYNFPIVMATVHDSWIRLPQEQAETARLLGAGEARIFRTVTIYQLIPSIVSSGMLVFLYCFFSFLIILLFGGVGCTTLEVEIYRTAKATLNYSETAKLALTETSLACLFVALYSFLEQKSARTRGISFYKKNPDKRISGPFEVLSASLIFGLILLFFLAPLFSIFYNALSSAREVITLSTFEKLFRMRGFASSFFTTILVALASSFLCTVIAFFYSSFLRSFDSTGRILILRVLPMIPMAISSVITGVVIISTVKRGTVFHLILAQVFLTWPLAFRQIYASLSKIQQESVDAARLLSPHYADLLFKIYLPQSWRGILSAAGFCFAVSAGDTTLPLVLALPKFSNLSLFTYRLAGSYRFHEACAAGMILGLLCAVVFGLANKLKKI